MSYQHTQKAPLYWLLIVGGIVLLVGAWQVPEKPLQIVLLVTGVLTFWLAFCFRELTVREEPNRLVIAFGPFPLFRRRIPFADMQKAVIGKSSFLDGWGVHLSLSGGWVWNLWGFDCVDLWYKQGKKIRIGTDDPAGLEAFLKQRIDEQSLTT